MFYKKSIYIFFVCWQDGTVKLWHYESGRRLQSIDLQEHGISQSSDADTEKVKKNKISLLRTQLLFMVFTCSITVFNRLVYVQYNGFSTGISHLLTCQVSQVSAIIIIIKSHFFPLNYVQS